MKDLLKHLDVVTRMAEQHQRMLKQLEPLFGAGRMAEETMRPLLGGVDVRRSRPASGVPGALPVGRGRR